MSNNGGTDSPSQYNRRFLNQVDLYGYSKPGPMFPPQHSASPLLFGPNWYKDSSLQQKNEMHYNKRQGWSDYIEVPSHGDERLMALEREVHRLKEAQYNAPPPNYNAYKEHHIGSPSYPSVNKYRKQPPLVTTSIPGTPDKQRRGSFNDPETLSSLLENTLTKVRSQPAFTSEDVQLLTQIASDMGFQLLPATSVPAVPKARHDSLSDPVDKGQKEEKAGRELLLDMAYDMLHHLGNLPKLVREVVAHGAQLMAADSCSFFILDDTVLTDAISGEAYPKCGIVGHVAQSGQGIRCQYPENHRNFDPRIDTAKSRGYLAIPVMFGGVIKGVARVVRMTNSKMFRTSDEQLFTEFLDFSAVTMHNAEVVRRAEFAKSKTEAILDVSRHLAEDSFNARPLADMVLDEAKRLTGAVRGVLYMVEGEMLTALSTTSDHTYTYAMTGIAGYCTRNKEVVALEEPHKDPRYHKEVDNVEVDRGAMWVPVVAGDGGVVAVAQLVARPGRIFSKEDADMFYAFSTYVGIALRNYEIFKKLQKEQNKSVSALNLAQSLMSAGLDEKNFSALFVSQVKSVLNATVVELYEVNVNNQKFTKRDKELWVSIGQGIAGAVAATGDLIHTTEADEAWDEQTDISSKAILCVPVLDGKKVVGLCQVGRATPFNSEEIELLQSFIAFLSMHQRNTHQHSAVAKEKFKMDGLMQVLTKLTQTDIRKIDEIIDKIITGALELLNADRCTLFCVDRERNELYSRVASKTGGKEIRFRIDSGIAGEVAKTKTPLNIADAYADPRFNKEIDRQTGYKTESILTYPVLHEGDCVAVCQIMNKLNGGWFTEEDEAVFEFFSMFAGISLANASLLEFAVQAGNESMKLVDLMNGNVRGKGGAVASPRQFNVPGQEDRDTKAIIKMPVEQEEVHAILDLYDQLTDEEKALITSAQFNVHEYKFAPVGSRKRNKVIPLLLHLITDLGCIEALGVDIEVLVRFFVKVERLYRMVPYHNWFHAVDVVQTMFLFIKTLDPHQPFDILEKYILLISSSVHDVDHMGVNNSFHLKTETPMGILNSATSCVSVLEVHHCNLAIHLLGDETANAFHSLNSAQSTYAYKCLVNIILATDMAKHGELLKGFKELSKLADASAQDVQDNKMLFMKMLIKSCDVSNVCKPYPVAKEWAAAVTEEFYTQGDMEKKQGFDILPMFDREKSDLAKGQVGFINFLALHQFNCMVEWYDGFQWTLDGLTEVRSTWQKVIDDATALEAKLQAEAEENKAGERKDD